MKSSPLLEPLKSAIRLLEARWTPVTADIHFDERKLRFVKSFWWNEADQGWFDQEIVPYFQALPRDYKYQHIIDAGGSNGLFAIAAAIRFPNALVEVFEPSERQQLLIVRNARANGVHDRVRLHPAGLWDNPGRLAFRTHGAISSFQEVSALDRTVPFRETAEVTTLDFWAEHEKIQQIDLIKMDIEGAEIEALKGGMAILSRCQPDILLQAYHIRDGERTLERCTAILSELGYKTVESPETPGFVFATVR